jgi:hypothetical protein
MLRRQTPIGAILLFVLLSMVLVSTVQQLLHCPEIFTSLLPQLEYLTGLKILARRQLFRTPCNSSASLSRPYLDRCPAYSHHRHTALKKWRRKNLQRTVTARQHEGEAAQQLLLRSRTMTPSLSNLLRRLQDAVMVGLLLPHRFIETSPACSAATVKQQRMTNCHRGHL